MLGERVRIVGLWTRVTHAITLTHARRTRRCKSHRRRRPILAHFGIDVHFGATQEVREVGRSVLRFVKGKLTTRDATRVLFLLALVTLSRVLFFLLTTSVLLISTHVLVVACLVHVNVILL